MFGESSLRRLAFLRYLYGEAVRQSRLREPMCAISVLTLHDAAELFLVLACEHKDVGKKNMTFLAYWEELNRKLPSDGLTQKKAMSRLNAARVGLKHHGNMPAREAIEEYRVIATLFFEENTPTVFGIEFLDISMTSLVQSWAVKSDLEEAEELRRRDEIEGAVGKVAVAFYRLLERRAGGRDKLLSGLKWPTMSASPRRVELGGSPGRAKLDEYSKKMFVQILEQTEALRGRGAYAGAYGSAGPWRKLRALPTVSGPNPGGTYDVTEGGRRF